MGLPIISGEFSVVNPPELRFDPQGKGWAKMRVVAKDRVKDDQGNWKDSDPMFIDVTVNSGAENLIESNPQKGDMLVITGRLKYREYEHNGQKRTDYYIAADNVGVSTRLRIVTAHRPEKGTNVASIAEALGATEVVAAPF